MLKGSLKGYLYVTGAATLWGVAGVAVRFMFVAKNADPVTLVQFRMTLTFLIIGAVLACTKPGLLRVRPADLPFLAVYGTAGLAACQVAYYWAIHETNVAVAIFLEFLAPVFTALYEILVLRHRPGKATFVVLGVALTGSLLLVLGRGGGLSTSPAGLAAGLLSALALAFYSLAGRRGVARYNPWTLLFWGTAAGSLMWGIVQPPWVVLARPWTAGDWAFFFYLAIFSSTIPFGLYLTGLRFIGPTSAILTAALEPVWATFLAAVVLGEGLAPAQAMGCVFILAAVTALQVVPGAALMEPPRPGGGDLLPLPAGRFQGRAPHSPPGSPRPDPGRGRA